MAAATAAGGRRGWAERGEAGGGARFPVALSCPACGARLPEPEEEALGCGSCGAAWPRRHDIISFCDSGEYWGEVSRETMEEIIATAPKIGWRRALAGSLADRQPDILWYASSEARADFRFLLPIDPDAVVLDAGAGWGSLAIPLARAYHGVVACEAVYERLRFLEIRAAQERIRNLQLVHAEIDRVPFFPASFDAVVANGLLEWVGTRSPEPSPRDAQIAFLRTVRRLLRPGGVLYVGIENRFGMGQWRGDVDHSGFPYTSLMPRKVADRYVRWRQRRGHGLTYRAHGAPAGYRTYTYSLGGYRRLLAEAGFGRVEAYTSLQGYNDPHQLVPLECDGALRFFHERVARPRSVGLRLLRAWARDVWWPLELGLRRFLAPSFLLVARVADPAEDERA